MQTSIIAEVSGLTKRYGSFTAVNDLSFTVERGDVYGFLGENGAGKSTTMRLMLGLIHKDAGSVKILGKEFSQKTPGLLRHVGAIIERPDLYNYLSGVDNLRILASVAGTRLKAEKITQLLELTGLQGRGGDKVKTYSQGMKQRLAIAVALAHDPELLILDEPTNGLDPQGIVDMRHLIRRLSAEQGKTIILSSHLLYEIEQVATRVLIVHRGRRMTEGPLAALSDAAKTAITIHLASPAADAVRALQGTAWMDKLTAHSPDLLYFEMHPSEAPALNHRLVSAGVSIAELRTMPSLESLFLRLTGE